MFLSHGVLPQKKHFCVIEWFNFLLLVAEFLSAWLVHLGSLPPTAGAAAVVL